MEVKLEYAALVFQRTDCDGRDWYIDRAEPIIGFLCLLEVIALVLGNGIDAEFVFEHAKSAIKAGVWPHGAGNSEAHRLDAAQVVSRIVHVEQHLRQCKFAGARLLQLD